MEHSELLSRLAKINHDNTHKFKVTDKLDEIRNVLNSESPYKEIYPGKICSVWAKTDNLPRDVILMSTHIDTVKNITKPFSELKDGIYKGTYDNLATNAACCALMMEEDHLPDNVVFTFDGDEETGWCHGLKEAVKWLKSTGHNIIYGIAADVTYEGFYDNKLASYENMTGKKEDLNNMFEGFKSTEPDNMKTFSFVPISKDMIPDNATDYFEGSTGMLDEAFMFKDFGIPGLSICVPTEGNMHSDSGLQMKEAVFEGYILSLATAVYSLTHTHEGLIEAYKTAKENLTAEAAEIVIEKPKPTYYGRTWYFDDGEPSDHVYVDDDYDYDTDYDIEYDEEYLLSEFGVEWDENKQAYYDNNEGMYLTDEQVQDKLEEIADFMSYNQSYPSSKEYTDFSWFDSDDYKDRGTDDRYGKDIGEIFDKDNAEIIEEYSNEVAEELDDGWEYDDD